ncbi:MAG: hypothetical protein IJ193_06795 [Bacilli bacterium]|nr:hypothetical protein [Bacilli bacterium]
MFGDELIVGEGILTLGQKNRIVLPKFTGAEKYDIIIPHYNREKSILSFYSSKEFYELSEKFENKLMDAKREGKVSYSELLKLRRYYYATLSFGSEAVDAQRRIVLDKRIVSHLQIEKQMYVVGCSHHLELCRDKKTYEMAKQKTYQKGR